MGARKPHEKKPFGKPACPRRKPSDSTMRAIHHLRRAAPRQRRLWVVGSRCASNGKQPQGGGGVDVDSFCGSNRRNWKNHRLMGLIFLPKPVFWVAFHLPKLIIPSFFFLFFVFGFMCTESFKKVALSWEFRFFDVSLSSLAKPGRAGRTLVGESQRGALNKWLHFRKWRTTGLGAGS